MEKNTRKKIIIGIIAIIIIILVIITIKLTLNNKYNDKNNINMVNQSNGNINLDDDIIANPKMPETPTPTEIQLH